MAKKKADPETVSGAGFEESLRSLQETVRDLESGGLTLSQSLERYELGVRHLKHCMKLLEQTELRIRELVEVDERGNAVLKNFEHARTVAPGQSLRSASPKATRSPQVPSSDLWDDDSDDTADGERGPSND